MEHLLPIGLGAASGFALKKTINWVDVDSFKINNNNFFLNYYVQSLGFGHL